MLFADSVDGPPTAIARWTEPGVPRQTPVTLGRSRRNPTYAASVDRSSASMVAGRPDCSSHPTNRMKSTAYLRRVIGFQARPQVAMYASTSDRSEVDTVDGR